MPLLIYLSINYPTYQLSIVLLIVIVKYFCNSLVFIRAYIKGKTKNIQTSQTQQEANEITFNLWINEL